MAVRRRNPRSCFVLQARRMGISSGVRPGPDPVGLWTRNIRLVGQIGSLHARPHRGFAATDVPPRSVRSILINEPDIDAVGRGERFLLDTYPWGGW